ncbi:hypothetical protein [Legionella fairfieldensis]|uniref:hypothetical protein n=1 Tax=Legionella fairfieldensis TaxID=45064 RepID=UPI00048A6C65|nr:hypothetical protein [Legionella fairfieldensis]
MNLLGTEDKPFSNDSLKEKFTRQILHESALASNNMKDTGFNLEHAKEEAKSALLALGANNNGLESMIAAQMLSIHKLQQKTMCYAQNINNFKLEQYYINSGVKLAKCFVQQANLLAKLQGMGGQKITVERVEVHQGGQAIVGNIHRGVGNKEKT